MKKDTSSVLSVIRPTGKLYVFANVVIITFFIAMIAVAVWASVSYWDEFKEDIIAIPFVLAALLIAPYVVIDRIVDVIKYKAIILEDKITLPANKMPFTVVQKEITVTYNGLKSIQYVLGFERAQIMSKIIFIYDTGKQSFINIWKFSDRQVESIIQEIIINAEKYANKSIERLPDLIQEGFKRKINK